MTEDEIRDRFGLWLWDAYLADRVTDEQYQEMYDWLYKKRGVSE